MPTVAAKRAEVLRSSGLSRRFSHTSRSPGSLSGSPVVPTKATASETVEKNTSAARWPSRARCRPRADAATREPSVIPRCVTRASGLLKMDGEEPRTISTIAVARSAVGWSEAASWRSTDSIASDTTQAMLHPHAASANTRISTHTIMRKHVFMSQV